LVVDPHDVDANAAALRRLADDVDLRRDLGARVRDRALRLDWASVAAARANAFKDRMGI
jgi:glycosyltransferase involved in cell wall biosynthesis